MVEPLRTDELLSIIEVFVEVPTAPFAGWRVRNLVQLIEIVQDIQTTTEIEVKLGSLKVKS